MDEIGLTNTSEEEKVAYNKIVEKINQYGEIRDKVIELALSKFISSIIANSMEKIKNVAKEIADGNLNIEIELESTDEIWELENSFLEMTKNLGTYINEISNILGSIANGELSRSTSESCKGDLIKIKEI